MQENTVVSELIVTDTGKWMPCPKMDIDYPGLAYLCPLEELIIAEKLDPLHEVIGKTDAGYTIFNTEGQKILLAAQKNQHKKFDINVYNLYGNEVIELRKNFKWCVNKIHIWSPPGNFIVSVEETVCLKTLVVKNSLQEAVLKIQPRNIPNGCDYDIYCDGEKVGLVTNRWRLRSILNIKTFGVSFPIFMSVEHKVMILGATFFIGCSKY